MKQIDLDHYKEHTKNSFKVPEAYFDEFAENMMQQIPDVAPSRTSVAWSLGDVEGKTNLFARIKPYLYLAAMISGLAFGIKVYKMQQQYYTGSSDKSPVAITNEQAEQYVDNVCDFAMINSNDIYACVTDNY